MTRDWSHFELYSCLQCWLILNNSGVFALFHFSFPLDNSAKLVVYSLLTWVWIHPDSAVCLTLYVLTLTT